MAMLVGDCGMVHLTDAKHNYILQCNFQWQQVGRGCNVLNLDLA